MRVNPLSIAMGNTSTCAIGLAIDTTFDDTSVAVIQGKGRILANLTLSQHATHLPFGGVMPELASRKHLEAIHPLIAQAMEVSGKALGLGHSLPFSSLDYVAASALPGLIGAILIGITTAKTMAQWLKIPFLGINHIEAHPYANFLLNPELKPPLLHLVVAGGHTVLIWQKAHFHWKIVGHSVDDAAGECVDKAAKMWGHPMPGGPVVDAFAMEHEPSSHRFPLPMLHSGDFQFSFSGLKTAMLDYKQKNPQAPEGPTFAAFYRSVCEILLRKTMAAKHHFNASTIALSGGLAASKKLHQVFTDACNQEGCLLYVPPPALCTDNAAMVACLAAYRFEAGDHDTLDLAPQANLPQARYAQSSPFTP